MPRQKKDRQKNDSQQPISTNLIPVEQSAEVRSVWYENEWYYAIVDFIQVWTESSKPHDYWRIMKLRADPELRQVIDTQLISFPMKAADGRRRQTETANSETLLRLVQSVPSKNAEKIRLWLAKLGNERIKEMEQEPSEAERLREKYRRQGYDENWIEARIADLLARNEITATWKDRGAEDTHYPMLTNVLVERTFGIAVKSYKTYKRIAQSAVLPDNMTPEELAFNILSKTTARNYHETRDSEGIEAIRQDVMDAGDATGRTREEYEKQTGIKIVSSKNAKDLKSIPPARGKKAKELLSLQQDAQKQLERGQQPSIFDALDE